MLQLPYLRFSPGQGRKFAPGESLRARATSEGRATCDNSVVYFLYILNGTHDRQIYSSFVRVTIRVGARATHDPA